MWAFLIKQLFHSRFVGYEIVIANSATPRWLSTISYPTRARGIIVNYFSAREKTINYLVGEIRQKLSPFHWTDLMLQPMTSTTFYQLAGQYEPSVQAPNVLSPECNPSKFGSQTSENFTTTILNALDVSVNSRS